MSKQPSPAHIEDEWQRRTTHAAIQAAQSIVSEGSVNPRAMVSTLSELEWGWIVCAAIFGWISCKAEQAVAEGQGLSIDSTDAAIRTMTHRSPAPWEAGAISTILQALAGTEGIEWDKPVGDWSKDQIVAFVWQAYRLTDAALAARDEGAKDVITRLNQDREERVLSAEAGGPLMSRAELNNPVPF